MNTRCLCGASSLRYFSTDRHRVPRGSRASRICRMTSDESITLSVANVVSSRHRSSSEGKKLTQFVPYPLGLAFGENRFHSRGDNSLITLVHVTNSLSGLGLCSTGLATQQPRLLQFLFVRLQALDRVVGQLVNIADTQLHTLPRRLGPEDLGERRGLDSHLGLVLLEPVDAVVLAVADQAEGQLVALEQDSVGVLLLLGDGVAEGAQRLLADDAAVGEPFPVGLDAGVGQVAALVAGGLDDLALGVALRLALLEDVELLGLLCGPVEVFSGGGGSVFRYADERVGEQGGRKLTP